MVSGADFFALASIGVSVLRICTPALCWMHHYCKFACSHLRITSKLFRCPFADLRPVMIFCRRARVAELADAPDSKSGGRKAVMVRPHSRAPKLQLTNPNVENPSTFRPNPPEPK